MGGSSTGDAGNFFKPENLFNEAINGFANVFTGGLVGYKDGQVGAGIAGKPLVNGLKEITGAAAAEEANKQARKQFDKTVADANQARVDQQNQNAQDQVSQSRLAARGRTSTTANAAGLAPKQVAQSSSMIGDERDFLGL